MRLQKFLPLDLMIGGLLLLTYIPVLSSHTLHAEELLLDFVIASIEGNPITLSEVSKRAGVPQPTSLQEASSNQKIQFALQQMIYERLLKTEAKRSRVSVSPDEVERYVQRVATQNGLEREEFVKALEAEGKNFAAYQKQVEMDIIRTKLAASLMRDGVTISEDEIDSHLESNSEINSSGSKIKLRQIVLERERISEDEAISQLNEIRNNIDSTGDFEDAAKKYSHGGEASDGGLLGVLTQEELRGPIFDALLNLKEGEVSEITQTPLGYHLFYIEERYGAEGAEDDDDDDSDSGYREEVRKELEQRKLEERMQEYFAQELLEKYAVEKKI